MIEIDITELLEDYADLLDKCGVPRTSTESKLILKAKEEIERLRKSLEFQIEMAENNNKSRLRLLDVIENARELYEATCKDVREATAGEYVCGMCKWDCDHGIDGYANECPGFEDRDCFELDNNTFKKIIYRKETG